MFRQKFSFYSANEEQTMDRLKMSFMFLELWAENISDSNCKSDCIVLHESKKRERLIRKL